MARRILYVQFTDPAAYPPVEHSSSILAKRGWEVLLLGASTARQRLFQLPHRERLHVKAMRLVNGGWRHKIQYVLFCLWTIYWTWRWKPQWIYASDPIICPVILWVKKFTSVKVIYHEHDSPNARVSQTWFMKHAAACRDQVAKSVELCILPQQERLLQFVEATKRSGPTICVWNCPRLEEIEDAASHGGPDLTVYYHGNISSDLLPESVIIAASRFEGAILVKVAGYEAPGDPGYVQRLRDLAKDLGFAKGLEVLGAMPRKSLFYHASRADVGVSLMPGQSNNYNLKRMVGASNKTFDYMACGLPLLVSNLPEWVSAFVAPGYGRACDPGDPDSIEEQLRWYLEHREKAQEMGRRARERIRQDWNYESMFNTVVERLETQP